MFIGSLQCCTLARQVWHVIDWSTFLTRPCRRWENNQFHESFLSLVEESTGKLYFLVFHQHKKCHVFEFDFSQRKEKYWVEVKEEYREILGNRVSRANFQRSGTYPWGAKIPLNQGQPIFFFSIELPFSGFSIIWTLWASSPCFFNFYQRELLTDLNAN